jgi:hypothetical protein
MQENYGISLLKEVLRTRRTSRSSGEVIDAEEGME